MGKVWTPGGGTKGHVPEEHPLSPPSLLLGLQGRQCLFVECSASASFVSAPLAMARCSGVIGRASYAMVMCALSGRWCVELSC